MEFLVEVSDIYGLIHFTVPTHIKRNRTFDKRLVSLWSLALLVPSLWVLHPKSASAAASDSCSSSVPDDAAEGSTDISR